MKSTKENPCAIPDINDTICIPFRQPLLVLTTAAKSKFPGSGEDAYFSKALMHGGTKYQEGDPLIYELWWKVPAGGVDAIQWEHPDSILLTANHIFPDVECVPSRVPISDGKESDSMLRGTPLPDPAGSQKLSDDVHSYIPVTSLYIIGPNDGQDAPGIACARKFIRDGDTPDENGQIPIYTFLWHYPAGMESQYRKFELDTPDEIVRFQDHARFLPKSVLNTYPETWLPPTHGNTEPLDFTVFRWQSSACLIQRKRYENSSDPDEIYVYDLNKLVGMPAEATFSEEGLL